MFSFIFLQEFQMFSMRLSQVAVPISRDVLSVLWQQCGQLAAQIFVEGYVLFRHDVYNAASSLCG